MTDEMIEAVARAVCSSKGTNPDMCISGRSGTDGVTEECFQRAWELEVGPAHTAIAAHEESLAKAGLGIRPRKATEEMAMAGQHTYDKTACGLTDSSSPIGAAWQDMFDAYKPDG